MAEDKAVWTYERAYLKRVAEEIERQLDTGIHAADNYKKDAIALQKQMWEDVRLAPTSLFDLENVAQMNQIQMELRNKASITRFSYEKVERLKQMRRSAYFGRIDFAENGEAAADKIYIGMYNLSDADTLEILVYDWRAPVAGMFYDFEIGPASYSCPAGLIEGQIRLKRQYRIEGAEIVYMFDSSLSINDAMLQELLGKTTDTRMKTIVASIQKEQNAVIRNGRDKILIVEGPAGSGKTSIALHRAAYLLYRYRDTLQSENILIFSPNHVFEDYIAHVLPELGEENILRSTFGDFFAHALPEGRQTETVNQQMEYILHADAGDPRLGAIAFKSSARFLELLKRYVRRVEDGDGPEFKDLTFQGEPLVSAEELARLYRQSAPLPCAHRLEKIRQRLLGMLEDRRGSGAGEAAEEEDGKPRAEQTDAESERLAEEIARMTRFDIASVYADMLRSAGASGDDGAAECRALAEDTIRELEQGTVCFEDLAPMAYLKAALEGETAGASVKHVIIDEAQDYTPVQYALFKTVFRGSNMTILGDVNQTVNGYMNIGSFDAVSAVFGADAVRIALTKSYRSSRELADFCRRLLVSPGQTEPLNRHGAKPKVIRVGAEGAYRRMAEDIAALKGRGCKLIAVICKTASGCRAVYQAIRGAADVALISNQNEVYAGEVVVIPSYLAKGLEFDAVLVHAAEERDYHAPEDRRLLYTICTRALHELYLYYSDTLTGFVSGMDGALYTAEDAAESHL